MHPAVTTLVAVAAIAFLGARAADLTWAAIVLKPIPVLALAAGQLRARGSAWPLPIAVGLLLSAVGDVLLELPGDYFVPGLVAFLLAHVAYVVGFTARAPSWAPLRLWPFAAFGLGMFLFLRPGLGGLAAPVAAYVVVICVMGWRAAAVVGRVPPMASVAALVGALTFMASDTVLALHRFHAPVAGASILIMITYWLGQVGIALSTVLDE